MDGGKYALVHKSFGALPLRPVPIYEGALPRSFRSINSFDEYMPRMRCQPFLMRIPCERDKVSYSKGLRPSFRMFPSNAPNPFRRSTPLINRKKQLLSFRLNIMRSHSIRETFNRKDDYNNKPPQYACFGRVTHKVIGV